MDRSDPEHGPRAAEFTETLRNTHNIADDAEFSKLIIAIRDHTLRLALVRNVDIATCWNADRFRDIGRVRIKRDGTRSTGFAIRRLQKRTG